MIPKNIIRKIAVRLGSVLFAKNTVEPLALPPPYRKMVAINSDVEWTSWQSQLNLLRSFADRDLEISFSFWMFGSPQLTWRLFDESRSLTPEALQAIALMKEGLFDTLHSFGGRSHLGGCEFSREDMIYGYKVLADHQVHPMIYTNHGGKQDRQNIAGDWATYQEGDLPGSDLYHLDISFQNGAKFFWCDPDYVINQPFLTPEMDTDTGLFLSAKGRDGSKYLRFKRYMGEGIPAGPSLDNLHFQLSQLLNSRESGYSIVYQHLGVQRQADGRPSEADTANLSSLTIEALDALMQAQLRGEVLVTTTSRLLLHAAMMTARPWKIRHRSDDVEIRFNRTFKLNGVEFQVTPEILMGWTLPLRQGDVIAYLGDSQLDLQEFFCNGLRYFGFPWEPVDMKKIISEYIN